MKRTPILCCFLVLLAACKNDRKQPKQTPPPPETVSTDTRPAVLLEGVYATSTQPGSDVAFLFDAENNNFWQTKPGAGPDEGLMLYFRNPVQLSALQLQAEGNSFAPAPAPSAMQVYVNGTLITTFNSATQAAAFPDTVPLAWAMSGITGGCVGTIDYLYIAQNH